MVDGVANEVRVHNPSGVATTCSSSYWSGFACWSSLALGCGCGYIALWRCCGAMCVCGRCMCVLWQGNGSSEGPVAVLVVALVAFESERFDFGESGSGAAVAAGVSVFASLLIQLVEFVDGAVTAGTDGIVVLRGRLHGVVVGDGLRLWPWRGWPSRKEVGPIMVVGGCAEGFHLEGAGRGLGRLCRLVPTTCAEGGRNLTASRCWMVCVVCGFSERSECSRMAHSL